jgi:IclR family transcriptional regulator, pca regulon regulatory protein
MTKGKLEQGDYIQSLEKGLAIIRAFGQDDPTLTLSEAAEKTGMTRAAARRFLLTLTHLGYLEIDGKSFRLRPKILELGERYLTSQPWWNVAQPLIEEAVRKMGESCSLCILDGAEIVYVCRVAVSRLISTNISIGSRLPAYPTALGRVLLAQRPESEIKELLAEAHLEKYTKNTVTDKRKLLQIIKQTQSDGFCLIDQELDVGLVGLAVPVCRGREGFAALGVSVHAGRVSTKEMMSRLLPILKETANRIGLGMTRASAP